MTDVHKGRVVTDAIVAALTAAGLRVGDGIEPAGAGWTGPAGQSTFNGYVVVHPLPGGDVDGTIAAAYADAAPLYQLSAYGASRAHSEAIADQAREALLPAVLTITGRAVAQVRLDMLGGSARVDGVQPPIWQAADRYEIQTTSNNT